MIKQNRQVQVFEGTGIEYPLPLPRSYIGWNSMFRVALFNAKHIEEIDVRPDNRQKWHTLIITSPEHITKTMLKNLCEMIKELEALDRTERPCLAIKYFQDNVLTQLSNRMIEKVIFYKSRQFDRQNRVVVVVEQHYDH